MELSRLDYLASEVTERQLSELASNLVKENDETLMELLPWEELVKALGLSNADVYRHKEENKYNPWAQCFNALVQWKYRYYKQLSYSDDKFFLTDG